MRIWGAIDRRVIVLGKDEINLEKLIANWWAVIRKADSTLGPIMDRPYKLSG